MLLVVSYGYSCNILLFFVKATAAGSTASLAEATARGGDIQEDNDHIRLTEG